MSDPLTNPTESAASRRPHVGCVTFNGPAAADRLPARWIARKNRMSSQLAIVCSTASRSTLVLRFFFVGIVHAFSHTPQTDSADAPVGAFRHARRR